MCVKFLGEEITSVLGLGVGVNFVTVMMMWSFAKGFVFNLG